MCGGASVASQLPGLSTHDERLLQQFALWQQSQQSTVLCHAGREGERRGGREGGEEGEERSGERREEWRGGRERGREGGVCVESGRKEGRREMAAGKVCAGF